MIEAILIAIVLAAIIVAVLVLSRNRPLRPERAYYERPPSAPSLEGLDLSRFEHLCLRLLEAMGLVVKSSRQIGPTDLEIVAADPQPITGSTYLVHGIHAGGQNIVDRGRVLTLASAVKGEQAAKGILITTGYFAEDAALPPEGAPIELINRARLTDLIREHGIVL